MPNKKSPPVKIPDPVAPAEPATAENRARAAFDQYRQRMGSVEPTEGSKFESGSQAWNPIYRTPPWGFPFPAPAPPYPGFASPPPSMPYPGIPGMQQPGAGRRPAQSEESLWTGLGVMIGLGIGALNAALQGGTQLLYGLSGGGPAPAGCGGGAPWAHPGPDPMGDCCKPCGGCLYGGHGCHCSQGVHNCR